MKPVVKEDKKGFSVKKGLRFIVGPCTTFDELKTAAGAIKDVDDLADANFAIARWEASHAQALQKAIAN